MSEPTSPAKRLEIRKYPNRRYYDTTRSQHVTLEQIYALIREGYEVRVVDSKTGHDITAKILAQIIIELDAPKLGVFPVTMLHRLLQSNQDLVTQFVQKYFNQPLMAFMDAQRNTGPSAMADWTRLMWGPFNPSFWSTPSSTSPAPETTSVRNEETQLKAEMDALRQQVAELRSQLGTGRKPDRKPPSRKRNK
jgi:polyhydroxyalkanoate synthesis repressor PhaR